MNVFLNILLTFSVVYGFYILFSALLSYLSQNELGRYGFYPDQDGNYTISCDADTLEYLIRCALMATTFERCKIYVRVRENDDKADFIAERMRRRHKKVILRREINGR